MRRLVNWSRGGDGRRRKLLELLVGLGGSLLPKDRERIVVYSSEQSEDGALAVIRALVDRGFRPVRLTNGVESPAFQLPHVSYRSKYSWAGLWAFLRAGTVISSQAIYGGQRAWIGQRIVLLWHGELVKPVGLLDGSRPVRADVAPVCSSIGQAFRSTEFNLSPEKVPILGAPRNDRLLGADRERVRLRLGLADDRRIWLWLPTYRTAVRGARRHDGRDASMGLPYSPAELEELDRQLEAMNISIVLKPHPLAEQNLRGWDYGRLHLLTQQNLGDLGVSLYEIMASVDGLVTDASSAWVDFLLLDKPIVFAFPDLLDYRTSRGLNLEPYEAWIPGPLVGKVDQLVHEIAHLSAGQDGYAERRRWAREVFHRYTDDGSTARLLSHLSLPHG